MNTATPVSLFHMNNGGLLSTGAVGGTPVAGVGVRMMWIPARRAFRAGEIDGGGTTNWDNANIGLYSFAVGLNPLAFGANSFAFGNAVQAIGSNSFAFGNSNFSSGNGSFAFGQQNIVTNTDGVAYGFNNLVDGFRSYAFGNSNNININAMDCYAWGSLNINNPPVTASICLFTIGKQNTIAGNLSGTFGRLNNVSGNDIWQMGSNLSSTANSAFVFGSGLVAPDPLLNNIANSLMVGFNSDSPTLFVSGGDGNPDSFGDVGIGNITAPTQRLDVNGNARFRTIPIATPTALILGYDPDIIDADIDDFVLTHLNFTANSNEFLAGDGTWQTTIPCTWDNVGTSNVATGFSTACRTGNVGIGTQTPVNKLHVYNSLSANGVTQLVNSVGTGAITNYGIFSRTQGGTVGIVGVEGSASATTNGNSGSFGNIFGVRGVASHTPYCYYNSYGVYGEATGTVPCGTITAGYFAGTVVTLGSVIPVSDVSLKINVQEETNALELINELTPVNYSFNLEDNPDMGLEDGLHHGFIAQDVEEVAPELVKAFHHPGKFSEDGEYLGGGKDLLGVNYMEIIPVLVKAVQEQQDMIEELQTIVAGCCVEVRSFTEQNADHATNVKLSNNAQPLLYQNQPNPHKGQCTIKYFLPEESAGSEIQFFDQYGNLLKIIPLTKSGMGQINLDATDLAAGMYSYALFVNGIIIDTKKMVKE